MVGVEVPCLADSFGGDVLGHKSCLLLVVNCMERKDVGGMMIKGTVNSDGMNDDRRNADGTNNILRSSLFDWLQNFISRESH